MGKFGVSFSWKRAVGITRVKQQIARATGIPTTKSGRQRKIGSLVGAAGIPLLASVRKQKSTRTELHDAVEPRGTYRISTVGQLVVCFAMFFCVWWLFSGRPRSDPVQPAAAQVPLNHTSPVAPADATMEDSTAEETDPPVVSLTSLNGKHTVEAKVIWVTDKHVKIMKGDGQTVMVPIDKLSEPSREIVRGERRRLDAEQHRSR